MSKLTRRQILINRRELINQLLSGGVKDYPQFEALPLGMAVNGIERIPDSNNPIELGKFLLNCIEGGGDSPFRCLTTFEDR